MLYFVSRPPVRREIAPTHFPSQNGSYDSFMLLPGSERIGACCTGTPPPVLDRNLVSSCLYNTGVNSMLAL